MNLIGELMGFIAVMATIVLIYKFLVERTRYKKREAEDTAAENADLLQRLEVLEERVRVLERIVTDDSSSLRDRISGL